MVAQAAGYAFGVGELGSGGPAVVRFGMNEERSAAIHVGAHDVDAALGLIPVLDDYVFQFFVEEILGGFFECRFNFDEIGKHAGGAEVVGFALLDGGKEALDAFGCISAVRKDFFE